MMSAITRMLFILYTIFFVIVWRDQIRWKFKKLTELDQKNVKNTSVKEKYNLRFYILTQTIYRNFKNFNGFNLFRQLRRNYIWHDKFKKYFFLSYVDIYAICTGLGGPLIIGWKKNIYPVKTDTIENNISLRVICET